MKNLFLFIIAVISLPVHASIPPWITLRSPQTYYTQDVDSIVGRDTVFTQVSHVVSGQFKPFVNPDITSFELNLLPFENVVRPVSRTSKIEYPELTLMPEYQQRVAWQNKNILTPSLWQSAAHEPILEKLRYDYAISNPSTVKYTNLQIKDPSKELLKVQRDKSGDKKEISRIFKTEVPLSAEMRKKKEKPAGPWKNSGEENLQFSQLFVENWIKGGENSATLTHDLRLNSAYSQGRTSWENSLVNKLSLTYTSALGTRVSSDAFDLASKYGFNAVNKWYYSFAFSLKTQLFRNYDKSDTEKANPKSKFMSPVYMQFIFGMDYKQDNFSLLLSPYTGIITAVADTDRVDQTKYGIAEDRKANFINGFSVTCNWKKEIVYGINYSTKLELFYEYIKKDGNKRFDWENVLDVQINRFLSTRLLIELRYFDNESDKFQIKENFSVGFKYSF